MTSAGGSRPEATQRPLDTILFESDVATIGSFRARPHDPRFHDSGPIRNHIFVFPRSAVWIRHVGEAPFVATPNVITFYNRRQIYRRDAIAEEGDRCEWFALAPALVLEAVGRFEPRAEERPERPFPFSHAVSEAQLYLRQRRLVREILATPSPDALRIEETCVELLDAAVCRGFELASPPSGRSVAAQRAQRDLAHEAAALLASSFRENFGLAHFAARLGVSSGHLCRSFRRSIGRGLHRYRDELRLRIALEEMEAGRGLTDLALDLGYSSHSHFTAAFRRCFGEAPSRIRRQPEACGSATPVAH